MKFRVSGFGFRVIFRFGRCVEELKDYESENWKRGTQNPKLETRN